ncbi:MAG: HAMP domain-containing histidine kinase [Clostridiales bacterium]|nr:HAMP domain-containing histidine kinase [Clostridiales bacterium]
MRGALGWNWFGWALLLMMLVATLVVCLVLLWRHKRESARLSDEINQFLNGEIQMPRFSVNDNAFAQFENAVVEIETRLRQSEENEREEGRRTAQLVADVSHQLKTPLAGLKLYAEMDESPHQTQSLQMIEHMEKLVHSLLRLEKLHADAYEFDFAMHKLSQIARDAAAEVQPLFPGVTVEIEGNAAMRCDAYWMGEALMNLIKNACEYTIAGGVVCVAISETEGLTICEVSDKGGGVSPEELSRIFARFSRGSKSSGVGLGLAIVRAVAEKHHGTAIAQNANGGLCITLTLPRLHHLLRES